MKNKLEQTVENLKEKIATPNSLQQIYGLIKLDRQIKTDEIGGHLYKQGKGLMFYEIPSRLSELLEKYRGCLESFKLSRKKDIQFQEQIEGCGKKETIYLNERILKENKAIKEISDYVNYLDLRREEMYIEKEGFRLKNHKYLANFHLHHHLSGPSTSDAKFAKSRPEIVISYDCKSKEEKPDFFAVYLFKNKGFLIHSTLKKGKWALKK